MTALGYELHQTHALCLRGKCRMWFTGKDFEFKEGDLMIIRNSHLVDYIAPSDDFRVEVIYVDSGFLHRCTPRSNYGVKGLLSLLLHPVIHLDDDQQYACRHDFDIIK